MSPASVLATTRRWAACAPASTGRAVPDRTISSPATSAAIGVGPVHAATSSPLSRPGSTAAFCSAEPACDTAWATTFTGTSGPGATSLPISSATSTRSSSPCSENEPPPSASDTSIEVHPSSAPRRQ